MMIASSQRKAGAPAGSAAMPGAFRHAKVVVFPLLMAAVLSVCVSDVTQAEERSATPMEARVKALIPELEAYLQSGMKAFDMPGVAVGIVTGDRLVYAKGFGVRSKSGGAPVDPRHRLSDRLAHQGIPRRHHGHHGRSRQAQVG